MKNQTITLNIESTKLIADLIASFVRSGITFNAIEEDHTIVIEFTGGF